MKKLVAFVFLSAYSLSSLACTTFFISKDGTHLFGRNYDWITETGMVMVNGRNIEKTSAIINGSSFNWVSSFGSISFNQYGKEFPTGGMNEKGLVVELMWLDQTEYPARDKRNEIGVLQWIQYQLDCSETVQDVIASNELIRIHDEVPLHYLVADAEGNAATIEFLDGKMVVHQKERLVFPVLTNTPYKEALENTGGMMQMKKASELRDNSLARFAKACEMVQGVKTIAGAPTVDYAFTVLDQVSQGDYTKWSIVYDISNRAIHFSTNTFNTRRSVSMNKLDFSCSIPAMAFSMQKQAEGDISEAFSPLTARLNRQLIHKSASESKSRVDISQASIDKAVAVAGMVKCK